MHEGARIARADDIHESGSIALLEACEPASSEKSAASTLMCKLQDRSAIIAVIGLGYVGLPLSLCVSDAGFRVLGFDISPERVEELEASRSPFPHIPSERVTHARRTGRFVATTDSHRLVEADAVIVCVPTPLGLHREPDLSFVENTARMLAGQLRSGQLIVLESTSYPGTTREIFKPILESTGLTSGIDFFLAYSPEREDPGNRDFETRCIPKVVAGDGEEALRLAVALYGSVFARIVPVCSLETAEAVKITENIFRAVNIALVNELKVVFGALGIDIFDVIEAAKTKPFGYMPFYPGPGLGGHCIPVDPFYLTWKAREHGIATRFIELAGEINASMPRYVVERLRKELDRRFGKGLFGAKILVVGIAYKKNVADMRESPALAIMEQLVEAGASVDYYDPFFPTIPVSRRHAPLVGKESIRFEGHLLAAYDTAVIVTDHDEIDYSALARFSNLVVDTRNVLARHPFAEDRIAKA